MYTKEEILKAMADMYEFWDWDSFPIPSEIDHMILALLRDVRDRGSYDAVLGGLRPAEVDGGLLGFGQRACSWAVQERSRELLVLGLVALARCGLGDPDVARPVPLYGRSAYLVGVPRDEVFEEAASIVPEEEARRLREYVQVAEPETQPLEGFREVGAGKDFRYEMR